MEIKNKLTVTRQSRKRDSGGKKGKGQAKEHEQRTRGHRQCRAYRMWELRGMGNWEAMGKKGGTAIMEQQ